MSNWVKKNKYYLACKDWTICKITQSAIVSYELWHGDTNKGYFKTADEAKKEYERLPQCINV